MNSYWNKGGNNVGNIEATFFLKRCFSSPKCFPNINIAYERCYFPQTLFSGKNVAKKRCKPPQFVVVFTLLPFPPLWGMPKGEIRWSFLRIQRRECVECVCWKINRAQGSHTICTWCWYCKHKLMQMLSTISQQCFCTPCTTNMLPQAKYETPSNSNTCS
jgi:hypothetical protein